jgi:hypothetical protein
MCIAAVNDGKKCGIGGNIGDIFSGVSGTYS